MKILSKANIWFFLILVTLIKINLSAERVYYPLIYPEGAPESSIIATGIRATKHNPRLVHITMSYFVNGANQGLVFTGNLHGEGNWNILNFPSSPGKTVTSTVLYGPNSLKGSKIQVVGEYTTEETGSAEIGFLYKGHLNGSGKWSTLIPELNQTIVSSVAHSVMRGLVVGNYITADNPASGKAFIYDIKKNKYFQIKKKNFEEISAYGIWYNGGDSYTICGSFVKAIIPGILTAFLVDWDHKKFKFKNWRKFSFDNNSHLQIDTHFNGITSDGREGYYLVGDALFKSSEFPFFCHVNNKGNSKKWSLLNDPKVESLTANSVYKKVVVGEYTSNEGVMGSFISLHIKSLLSR